MQPDRIMRRPLGNTNKGVGWADEELALQGIAMNFAWPRPPPLTPLALAPLFRTATQYGKEGLL
jgi:hypothetical protein